MKITLLFFSVFLTTSLFCQIVKIPDANFRAYLLGNANINTNGDTLIQVSEASVYDGAISCGFSNISDLRGIEAFVSITELYCNYNELTSLDVSQNTALTYLGFSYNQLTSLDVTNNTALIDLWCSNNQLKEIDVSKNTFLKSLTFNGNKLTEIDLSENTSLTLLYCDDNQLSSLDLSKNTSLSILSCKHNNFDHKTIQTQFESRKKEREIYDVTEIKPQFIGGDLSEFLKKNIVYPKLAKENGIQGKVFVQFIVWKDGTIRDVKVIKGVHETLDNEAIRIVQMMPKWKPAEHRGKVVNARFTLPVRFKQ